ncbi:MAG: heavy metal translocating P-type ATPase, partial [Sphaerochaetaceae bacterium]|nr:heavy metal translocating P-type ATPase [Sphaerochaetaceae bacterium]
MQQYNVTGMSCAACSSRVSKAVSELPGVTSCTVNLLTNSMGVEGTASPESVIKAVVEAGYGASVKGKETENKDIGETDKEIVLLKKRLIFSSILTIILVYFSMGHGMWGWKVPTFLDSNAIGLALVQMLLCISVMVINQRFFINGIKGLLHKVPNMDTLVSLGSGASFIWSIYVLFIMTLGSYEQPLYFESAAMILTLITCGKLLEAKSKGKTTNALKSLMKLAPKTATIIIDNKEVEVEIDKVKKGDYFAVRPGESIPVDGVVIEGSSSVNESLLTGESIPVDKSKDSNVSAATINISGYLKCQATRVGEDTTLSQIIKMVNDVAASKAPIAKLADRVAGVFVPSVVSIALITAVIWLLIGSGVGFALARAISVLVISCPCALGLATPVAIMVGNGVGAKNGILFKTAAILEETGRAKVVVLDKTGTITCGEPVVTDLICAPNVSEEALLTYAASLESLSEHPLSKAIISKASRMGIQVNKVTDFIINPGNGLEANCD